MKKILLIIVIPISMSLYLLAQNTVLAQTYPVSVVETGKTKGFDPPTLHLHPSDLLPKLVHNRSLHEPYLMNENADLGEVGAPIDFAFMAEMFKMRSRHSTSSLTRTITLSTLRRGIPGT